ncbi:transmembrane protease serine 6-like [Salarias fasciatus]|uniref:transmembrane protease serine 6-like n=1 Tax=Salarias fasciatus TaxID=181472 RepID=UPI001176D264|nr:transmembrane protease serine 6-like [Salarias fasciatus]
MLLNFDRNFIPYYVSILDRNFSAGLSSHSSPAFQREARGVQGVVEKVMKGSQLSRYFNSTTVFAFGEGSVVVHFWVLMSIPGSHAGRVTLQKVASSLQGGLRGLGRPEGEETASVGGYLLHLATLTVSDCYRYQRVASSSPVALCGPDTRRSSCMWHLQADAGSQLELHMEWLLPECRDRLVVYDSITPSDDHLITSVYGCSRHEHVVRVLSSGEWMTVVWKQGLYNYKDPFSLSAQAWDHPDCNATIQLEAVSGVQGTLRTPFFPSFYPPNTNCTWSFTVGLNRRQGAGPHPRLHQRPLTVLPVAVGPLPAPGAAPGAVHPGRRGPVAARLRPCGHPGVAVYDGGWSEWFTRAAPEHVISEGSGKHL